MKAKVERKVIDTLSLSILAKDETEALTKAEEVLSKYPEAHDVVGIPYTYVEDRRHLSAFVRDIRITYD